MKSLFVRLNLVPIIIVLLIGFAFSQEEVDDITLDFSQINLKYIFIDKAPMSQCKEYQLGYSLKKNRIWRKFKISTDENTFIASPSNDHKFISIIFSNGKYILKGCRTNKGDKSFITNLESSISKITIREIVDLLFDEKKIINGKTDKVLQKTNFKIKKEKSHNIGYKIFIDFDDLNISGALNNNDDIKYDSASSARDNEFTDNRIRNDDNKPQKINILVPEESESNFKIRFYVDDITQDKNNKNIIIYNMKLKCEIGEDKKVFPLVWNNSTKRLERKGINAEPTKLKIISYGINIGDFKEDNKSEDKNYEDIETNVLEKEISLNKLLLNKASGGWFKDKLKNDAIVLPGNIKFTFSIGEYRNEVIKLILWSKDNTSIKPPDNFLKLHPGYSLLDINEPEKAITSSKYFMKDNNEKSVDKLSREKPTIADAVKEIDVDIKINNENSIVKNILWEQIKKNLKVAPDDVLANAFELDQKSNKLKLYLKQSTEEVTISLRSNDIIELKNDVTIIINHKPKPLRIKIKDPKTTEIKIDLPDIKNTTNQDRLLKDFKSNLNTTNLPSYVSIDPNNIQLKNNKFILKVDYYPIDDINFFISLNNGSEYFINKNISIKIPKGIGIVGGLFSSNEKLSLRTKKIGIQYNSEKTPELQGLVNNFYSDLKIVDKNNNEIGNILPKEKKIEVPIYLLEFNNLKIKQKRERNWFTINPVAIDPKTKKVKVPVIIPRKDLHIKVLGEDNVSLDDKVNLSVRYNYMEISKKNIVSLIDNENIKYKVKVDYNGRDGFYNSLKNPKEIESKDFDTKKVTIIIKLKETTLSLQPKIVKGQEQWQNNAQNLLKNFIIFDKSKIRINGHNGTFTLKNKNVPFKIILSSKDSLGWELTSANINRLDRKNHSVQIKRRMNKDKINLRIKGKLPDGNIPVTVRNLFGVKKYNLSKDKKKQPLDIEWPVKPFSNEKLTVQFRKPTGYNVKGTKWISDAYNEKYDPAENKEIVIDFEKLDPVKVMFVDISQGAIDRKKLFDSLTPHFNNNPQSTFLFLSNGITTKSAENSKGKVLLEQTLFGLPSEITNFYSDLKKLWNEFNQSKVVTSRKTTQLYLILSESSLSNIQRDISYFDNKVKSLNIKKDNIKIISVRDSNVGSIQVTSSIDLR